MLIGGRGFQKHTETNYLGRISECPEQHLFHFKQN